MADFHDRISDESNVCIVGYALNAKKLRKSEVVSIPGVKNEWAGGGLADILQYSGEGSSTDPVSIVFSQWNPDLPPESQKKFNVIIHKLTEDIEREEPSEKITSLNCYLNCYPETKIVDPIDSVRKVTSRLRTVETLRSSQTALGPDCPFTQPKFIHVNSMSILQIKEALSENSISYPIICKPIKACGTPNSHSMVVIVAEEDLNMIPQPCIVQQYYNHDEVLYKAYVIDEDVMVYRRPSLPDLSSSFRIDGRKLRSLTFDSRYCYPKLENFLQDEADDNSSVSVACDSPKQKWTSRSTVSKTQHDKSQQLKNSLQNSLNSKQNHDHIDNLNKKQKVDGETLELAKEMRNGKPPRIDQNELSRVLNMSNELTADDKLYESFVAAAMELKKIFGLTLFGFDVILPNPLTSSIDHSSSSPTAIVTSHSTTLSSSVLEEQGKSMMSNELMIIDINYFPSYKEVKDFPDRLKSYLKKIGVSN